MYCKKFGAEAVLLKTYKYIDNNWYLYDCSTVVTEGYIHIYIFPNCFLIFQLNAEINLCNRAIYILFGLVRVTKYHKIQLCHNKRTAFFFFSYNVTSSTLLEVTCCRVKVHAVHCKLMF